MKSRKIIVLATALILMFSLCACSGSKDDVSGSVEQNEKTDVNGTVTNSDDKNGDTGSVVDDNSGAGSQTEELEFGSMTGGTYENKYFGFGCDLDENWTYASEDELLEINGIVEDTLSSDEALSELLENSTAVYDMYASADEGLVTINVVMENLGGLYGNTMDESAYVDIAVDNLKKALEISGFSNVSCEKEAVDFAGSQHYGTNVSCEYTDGTTTVKLYEFCACVKAGNYMAVVTVASYVEDITDDLLAMFYPVDK